MKAEIKGDDLLVYCDFDEELYEFIDLNNIKCQFSGTFQFNGYTGERTYELNDDIMVFWFKPEHLQELKFN